ncbi:MAG: protein kinase [Pseudomonadota bacterium]
MSSIDQVVKKWALGTIKVDPSEHRELFEMLQPLIHSSKFSEIHSIKDIERLKTSLNELNAFTNHWLKRLDTDFDLQTILHSGKKAWQQVSSEVDEDTLNELSSISMSLDEVKDLADLISSRQLNFIPQWVWVNMGVSDVENIDSGDVAHCLTVAENRDIIRKALEIILPEIDNYDLLLEEIRGIPPNSDFRELPALISKKIEDLKNFVINTLRSYNLEEFRELLGRLGTTNDECVKFCKIVENFYEELNTAAKTSIRQDIMKSKTPAELISTSELYSSRINELKATVPLPLLSYEIITYDLEKTRVGIKSKEATSYNLEIKNDVLESGRKSTLRFIAPDNDAIPYGHILFPVKIISHDGKKCSFAIEYGINSDLANQWPAEWEKPSPSKIDKNDTFWYKDSSDRLCTTIHIRIPLRAPSNSKKKSFGVKIDLLESDTQKTVGSRVLEWLEIKDDNAKFEFDMANWRNIVQTEWVDKHPVGPQTHAKAILNKVKHGNSFAVIAPRRFGKTTLASYIEQKSRDFNVLPITITCTKYVNQASQIDYGAIWQDVSKIAEKELGATISYDSKQIFPDESGFDYIRTKAKQKALTNVTLIFDEAQLLIGKPAIGNHLKDLLESHWSQEDEEKAPLCFGLLGLPSMYDRGGANLMGLLSPIEKMEFDEDNLSTLLKELIDNKLWSTSSARSYLVKHISNLYLLKEILQRVTHKIGKEHRNWITINDVRLAFESIMHELESGNAKVAAQYIRDIFNTNESINAWTPAPCYPTGVALAKNSNRYVSISESIERARNQLNIWCEECRSETESTIYTYTADKIEEQLNALQDLKVYDKEQGFLNDLYLAWLKGRSDRFPRPEDREALILGAMPCVELPQQMELVGRGDQASVYWFERNNIEYGCRKALLTDDEYPRFVESILTYEKLKHFLDKQSGNEAKRHIFELTDIGINIDHDNGSSPYAVQIYKWIDGTPLEKKAGKMGPYLVIEIALMVAKAINFLHQNGIYHRDISPSNIIWEETYNRPVLIDFGMAQLANKAMGTFAQSGYAAPEVRVDNPIWTAKADVYAFGKTMKALLDPNHSNDELTHLFDKCLLQDTSERISISDTIFLLDDLARRFRIEQSNNSLIRDLVGIANDHDAVRWFINMLEDTNSNKSLKYSHMGISHDCENHLSHLAFFISLVVEEYGKVNGLRSQEGFFNIWDIFFNSRLFNRDRDIEFVAHLRNSWAHSKKEKLEQFNRRNNLFNDTAKANKFRSGVQKIGKEIEVDALFPVVNYLMQ